MRQNYPAMLTDGALWHWQQRRSINILPYFLHRLLFLNIKIKYGTQFAKC
ncbi:hypothetical protein HPTD01_3448 [Halomonas sp. TD01]|nr:hypothetical protein HPTD01_3448 [Halomonas sp. TD01]